MDAFDQAFNLPLRRALPDLTLGLGLVPECGARGSWSWTCMIAQIDKPLRDVGRRLLTSRLAGYGLTLEDYLREQENRLRATHPAVAAVKLHLHLPGRMLGNWTPAHLALPRADMRHEEITDYALAVWARLTDRPELTGCDTHIVIHRRPISSAQRSSRPKLQRINAHKGMSSLRDGHAKRVPNTNRMPDGRYAPAKH
jgi:hypothetical protein